MEPVTAEDLSALLDRLKKSQRDLISSAARARVMPSDGTIRKVAELENAIAGVEAVLHETAASTKKGGSSKA
jgi:hypothetical protein